VGIGIADEHSSKNIYETEDIKNFPSATSSVSCHLSADTETLNHYSGDNLKHLNNDQISAGGGSTVSTSRTKDSSEDPWSETAYTDQSLVVIKDDLEQVSRISSIEEDKSIQLEKDKTCEDAVNGHRENDLITDMFATGFDLWTDGNPQDLAQLLFNGESVELPSQVPAPEPLPSWKSSSTKQSRFHFARQDHVAGEAIPLNTSDSQAGGQDRWIEKQHASLNTNASNILNEISSGESFQNKSGESFGKIHYSLNMLIFFKVLVLFYFQLMFFVPWYSNIIELKLEECGWCSSWFFHNQSIISSTSWIFSTCLGG
jgi:hypothetical protein